MIFLYDFPFTSARGMDFKGEGGAMKLIVGRQENISNSRCFIMAKTVTF